MPFVEVFSPPGTPRPDQRKEIAERLVSEVMAGEGAPDTEFARAISWLVWHDLETWCIGGATVKSDEQPRYVVRVSVPAASLTDAKRNEIVRRVTQVLADADEDPVRLFTSIACFVLITEIPEGNWGSIGKVFRFNEIAGFVMNGTAAGLSDDEVSRLVNTGARWEEAQG